jgi:2'-hydroxyisoflavone reductase
MRRTRREFLRIGAGALGALGLAACTKTSTADTVAPAPGRPLRILVLGGTGFIGPHLVRHAVSRGHTVTIFTRGKRQAELPDGVIRLIGDRNGQLAALEGKRWDAVIDDSATNPEYVKLSTQLLRDSVGRYMFTSSTGVYYPYLQRGADEARPVRGEVTDPEDGSEGYGVAKVKCEQQVMATFGERGIVVRPTYIIGPGDTTDRFPYWPVRLQRGGEVLAPGRKDDPVQWIDVRDLAEFMVHAVETQRSGIFNMAGPATATTMEAFLEAARAAINPRAQLTWIEDYAFLEAHEIFDSVPWVMLKGNDLGHTSASNAKAIAAGLTFRPLATTIRDTLAWWPSVPEERRAAPKFSIQPELEAKALADWHALAKAA